MPWSSSPYLYIAAPYGAPDPAARTENARAAADLARFATEQGWFVVCVHPGIEFGAYGDEADPKSRERGVRVAVRLAEMVAMCGGSLWAISKPDGTLSTGSQLEWDAFGRAQAGPDRRMGKTREGWAAIRQGSALVPSPAPARRTFDMAPGQRWAFREDLSLIRGENAVHEVEIGAVRRSAFGSTVGGHLADGRGFTWAPATTPEILWRR